VIDEESISTDGGRDESDEKSALRRELAVTVEVLVERTGKLSVLEEQIHQVKYQMESLVGAEVMLRGDAGVIVTRDAFRQTLKKKLDVLLRKRVEAKSEVERARDRRASIEEEIEELSK